MFTGHLIECLLNNSRTRFNVLLLFLLIKNSCYPQTAPNLINNPSFEVFTGCPDNVGQIWRVNNWFNGNQSGSPDFFTPCASWTISSAPNNFYGNQLARTGSNYLGFGVYAKEFIARECIETQLKQSLKPNSMYCVSYYVNLGEYSTFAIANIGAYFTQSVLSNTIVFPVPFHYYWPPHVESNTLIPLTDTLNWTRVEGIYNAQGGENFITIGNFRDDTQTNKIQIKPLNNPLGHVAYYFIDDVSVVEINPAKAYTTPTITTCANTTFTLGTDSTFDATYQWQPATALSCTNCPNPIANPTITTTYYVTKTLCSYVSRDSITVTVYTPSLTATAGNFKNICSNDTVTLGRNDTTFYTNYVWQPPSGLSCTNCPQPVAMPFSTTTYTLNKNECALNT